MSYEVIWKMEIYASSPREAAEKALAIHRDPASIATVFEVTDINGKTETVDLEEGAE